MSVKVGLKFIEKWKTDLEKQVCDYEAENAEPGQIVFYGPSNFTRWSTKYGMTPLREVLLGASGKPCCVNRGFGSTCPEHHLYYYHRMVKPLAPKILVYFPGIGNGLGFGYTIEEQWEMAQRVMVYAKTDFPDLKICLLGLNLYKASKGSRYEISKKFDSWLREFAEEMPDCRYISTSDYVPLHRDDIYVEDNVHYNQEGYRIYGDFFKEALKDELAQF